MLRSLGKLIEKPKAEDWAYMGSFWINSPYSSKSYHRAPFSAISECWALFPTHKLKKGMGTRFRRNHFWESFRWTSVTYDWLIVALNTRLLTLVHLNNPRNHCTESLYPFSLAFVKWRIANCVHFLLATTYQKHQFSFSSQKRMVIRTSRKLPSQGKRPTTQDKTFWDKSRKCLFFLSSWQKIETIAKWIL